MCHCPLSYEVAVEVEAELLVTKVDGVGIWPLEYMGGRDTAPEEVG